VLRSASRRPGARSQSLLCSGAPSRGIGLLPTFAQIHQLLPTFAQIHQLLLS